MQRPNLPHRDSHTSHTARDPKEDHTVGFTNAQLKGKDMCHDEGVWIPRMKIIFLILCRSSVGREWANPYPKNEVSPLILCKMLQSIRNIFKSGDSSQGFQGCYKSKANYMRQSHKLHRFPDQLMRNKGITLGCTSYLILYIQNDTTSEHTHL